jgi:prepilin-type N-terminal cleavage/methylation domain-containing protein
VAYTVGINREENIMHTNRSRGFTLIELLVVIAIIGILSAVVLASLNTARSKGGDAAIQSNLDTIRTQAELEYSNSSPNQYDSTARTTCPTAVVANTMWDTTIINAIKQAQTTGGTVSCHTSTGAAGAYAVSSSLITNSGLYYCVDSTGVSTTTGTGLGTGVTHC